MDGEPSKHDRQVRMDETMRLRTSFVAESCQLHYVQSPLKIMSSEGAYLIDDLGNRYLDCATRLSNIGHCHPSVVEAGRSVMRTLGTLHDDNSQEQFVNALLKTLPSNFEVCLFTNSGTEANDLAIQMARNYTRRKAVIVMDSSFHGSSDTVMQMSPKMYPMLPGGKPEWLTVVPLPDTYRGKHCHEIYAGQLYFDEARAFIQQSMATTGEVACLLSEPVFMVQGMIIPPTGYLNSLYNYIRSLGALVIADEIQLGYGRCGGKFWGFQSQGAIPDILTVGKPMGNGYPLSVVITSRKIAESIPNWDTHFRCESVAVAIGHSVLKTIESEQLIENGLPLMDYLYSKFNEFKSKYGFIGDVRRLGFIVGVDITFNKESKKPDPAMAEKISYKLKANNILVANEGAGKNILTFMPPFCVTSQDIDVLISSFARILTELELENSTFIFNELMMPQPGTSSSSFMYMGSQNRNVSMEEHTEQPFPEVNYDYSDDEARLEAEVYADMD